MEKCSRILNILEETVDRRVKYDTVIETRIAVCGQAVASSIVWG